MGRSKKLTDEEILRQIALSPDPVVTAAELAEELDYTRDGIRIRLGELQEQGFVENRDVGSRAQVWWITPRGREYL